MPCCANPQPDADMPAICRNCARPLQRAAPVVAQVAVVNIYAGAHTPATPEERRDRADDLASQAFDEVRARLGTPVNECDWKTDANRKPDEARLGERYNLCKARIGISENDEERNSADSAARETWMVQSAALAWTLRAGVCNSFGALTALTLHRRGVRGVRMVGTDAHNWADYGPCRHSVDPWLHEAYDATCARNGTTVVVDLSTRPANHYTHALSEAIHRLQAILRALAPPRAALHKLPWCVAAPNQYTQTNARIGRRGTGTDRSPLSQALPKKS